MNTLKQITVDIESFGGRCYVVGGYVRDMIHGVHSKDIDVEVYNIQPNILETILMKYGNPKLCGKSFGVYKLDNYDFAFPRRERKNGVGYRGFDVELDPFMSMEEAAKRRDLTINAIFMHPVTGEIIDPVNGCNDIKMRKLKHVSEKFAEDPLRVLRVAQFAARFNFSVDQETKKLCESLVPELVHLSKERVYVEIEKLLMKSDKPSIGFNFLNSIGALEVLFPELKSLDYVKQGVDHHPEGSALVHSLMTLDVLKKEERTIDLMIALLFHDLGKLVVENEIDGDSIHFKGHAEAGSDLCRKAMGRFIDEKNLIESSLNLIEYHMRPYDLRLNLNKKSVRRMATKVDFMKLMQIHKADQLGRGIPKDVSYINDMVTMYEEIKNEIRPILKGEHLIAMGLTPGKHFGPILKKAFEAQIDGEFDSIETGKVWLTEKKGMDCRICNGWRTIFISPGIPNITQTCPNCKNKS